MAVVVLGTFALGRFCPKVLAKVQDSPVQGICLLIILSHSSLSDTSNNILIPTLIPGVDTLHVRLQPVIEYFSGIHIPVALISLHCTGNSIRLPAVIQFLTESLSLVCLMITTTLNK